MLVRGITILQIHSSVRSQFLREFASYSIFLFSFSFVCCGVLICHQQKTKCYCASNTFEIEMTYTLYCPLTPHMNCCCLTARTYPTTKPKCNFVNIKLIDKESDLLQHQISDFPGIITNLWASGSRYQYAGDMMPVAAGCKFDTRLGKLVLRFSASVSQLNTPSVGSIFDSHICFEQSPGITGQTIRSTRVKYSAIEMLFQLCRRVS